MVKSALLASFAVAVLFVASPRPAAAVATAPAGAALAAFDAANAVENVHWVRRCYTQYGYYGPRRVCRQVYDPTPRYPRYPYPRYPYPRYPRYPTPYPYPYY
jgi:hypothetical protein